MSKRTTITGGNIPFLGGFGARVAIHGISFEGPFAGAILLIDAVEATIASNRVESVVGAAFRGVTFANAIETVFGGSITIKDNVIDDVVAAAGIGIEQFGAGDGVVVSGNRVSGTNLIAIEATNSTPARIVDNTVVPGAAALRALRSGDRNRGQQCRSTRDQGQQRDV